MHVARLFEAEDLRDVRVIQRRESLRLALESGHAVRIGRERLREDLDRDGAFEARIAGFIHFAHAARPDGGDDLVWTQARAGSKGQVGAPDYTATMLPLITFLGRCEMKSWRLGLDQPSPRTRRPSMRLCPCSTHLEALQVERDGS